LEADPFFPFFDPLFPLQQTLQILDLELAVAKNVEQ
jgi:hypothetical protein